MDPAIQVFDRVHLRTIWNRCFRPATNCDSHLVPLGQLPSNEAGHVSLGTPPDEPCRDVEDLPRTLPTGGGAFAIRAAHLTAHKIQPLPSRRRSNPLRRARTAETHSRQ